MTKEFRNAALVKAAIVDDALYKDRIITVRRFERLDESMLADDSAIDRIVRHKSQRDVLRCAL